MSTELINKINDVSIGGKIEIDGEVKGMGLDEMAEAIYKLSNNLQVPIYIDQKPDNPIKGALYINIEEE